MKCLDGGFLCLNVFDYFSAKFETMKYLLGFVLITTLLSCKKGEIKPYLKDVYLYANYQYIQGQNPTLTILPDLTSSSISIETTNSSAQIIGQRAVLNLFGAKIFDALGTYDVLEVETEEYRNGKWEIDYENFLSASKTSFLDIVLVLDVSSSLGSEVNLVKEYANEFIDVVFANNSNSRVGVVGFSQDIYVQNLTDNSTALKSFINSLVSQDATKLYEAIDKGIDLLFNTTNEGKAIVVFTDGKNNAYSSNDFTNSNFVYNRLLQPTLNNVKISCFTIGLDGKGGIDEDDLKRLALNGGFYRKTNDIKVLGQIFNKFASSVGSIYTFKYDRNFSFVSDPLPLRFKIKTQLY